MKRRLCFVSILFVLLLGVSFSASDDGKYGQFSSIYVFGDSFSDNGNFVEILGPIEQYMPYYYWQGRWSNGPVWVEYLAKTAHANLIDFAVGTATTGDSTHGMFYPYVPTVLDQIQSFCGGSVQIPANSLFIVQGGANDFFQNPSGSPQDAVDNIMAGVALLKLVGAKQILVANLPDLGTLPLWKAYPSWVAQLYSAITVQYNSILTAEISSFAAANPEITISICDWYSYFSIMGATPWKYSFKNITDESPDASNSNEEIDFTSKHYLFWDWVHPATQAHEATADFAGKDLKNLAKQKVN